MRKFWLKINKVIAFKQKGEADEVRQKVRRQARFWVWVRVIVRVSVTGKRKEGRKERVVAFLFFIFYFFVVHTAVNLFYQIKLIVFFVCPTLLLHLKRPWTYT